MSNVGSELAFILPKSEAPHYPKLFKSIDTNLRRLGISSYGVAITTLEDVFLRVGLIFQQYLFQYLALSIGRKGFCQGTRR